MTHSSLPPHATWLEAMEPSREMPSWDKRDLGPGPLAPLTWLGALWSPLSCSKWGLNGSFAVQLRISHHIKYSILLGIKELIARILQASWGGKNKLGWVSMKGSSTCTGLRCGWG